MKLQNFVDIVSVLEVGNNWACYFLKHSLQLFYELHWQMEEDQLDDVKLDGLIILRILDGIARDFTQAKSWV